MFLYTKLIVVEQNPYGFKDLVKLETVPMKTKIQLCTTFLVFSYKTSFFAGLGAIPWLKKKKNIKVDPE